MPNPEDYFVGDKIGVQTTFRTTAGTPTDTQVTRVALRRPDGVTLDLVSQIAHVGVGQFMVPYVIEQSGRHWFKFYGADPLVAAPEDYFDVALQRVS